MIRIGLIGYGYWGPNLVRNFMVQPEGTILQIADVNPERLALVQKMYPNIPVTNDIDTLLNNDELDAVIIATPVHTHYELTKMALDKGKHVLLEKPMTTDSKEAFELHRSAIAKGLCLMIDLTFLYTGAVQKMKELITSNTLGKLQYFDSTRINLGLFQADINVLWDLAPHDLSILLYLFDEKPISVNATGKSHTKNNIENIAFLTVNFKSDFIAHFNCSWSSPVKVRSTLIGGEKKMIAYNDLEPTEKVKVYDSGFIHKTDEEKNKILVDYRIGDIYIPKLSVHEALSGVASDFINAITKNVKPLASSDLGCSVVKILEAAQVSIKNNGKEIKIED